MSTLKIERTFLHEYMLYFGILLAPMTALRFGKIGPSEILLLGFSFLVLFTYKNKRVHIDNVTKFWLVFVFLLIIGTGVSIIFYNYLFPDISSIFTYLFFFVFSISLTFYYQEAQTNKILLLLEKVYFSSVILYSFLYLYAKIISPNFLGIPLWFGGVRFTGGALNPHQFAYTSGPLIFVGLYFAIKSRYSMKSVFSIIGSIMFFIMSIETKSATLYASLSLSVLVLFVLTFIKDRNRREEKIKFILLAIVILFTVLLFFSQLLELFWRFVESDPNGLGRFTIWSSTSDALRKSPFVGLGLNAFVFSVFGISETHNNYLEILINSGIFGIINYFYFIGTSLYDLRKSKLGLITIFFFLMYGLGGYSLRRVYYWFLIITMLNLERYNNERKAYAP